MQYNYESYSEKMQGIILEHNYDGSYHSTSKDYTLKILVTHPFSAKIPISMNSDTWNEYVNYYVDFHWRGFLESHPERWNRQDFYCNLQDSKFYVVSAIDDKGYPVWQETTLKKIIQISHLAWRFTRHINTDYNRFHVGQTCKFFAYAIDNNERLYKPSTIDENFSKYTWIYNPLTFTVHEITSESIEYLIDDLVAKTAPSKSAVDKILKKYKSKRKTISKKARQELKIKVKTTFSNLWKGFTKGETPISIVWKGFTIIMTILAIWGWFFRGKF